MITPNTIGARVCRLASLGLVDSKSSNIDRLWKGWGLLQPKGGNHFIFYDFGRGCLIPNYVGEELSECLGNLRYMSQHTVAHPNGVVINGGRAPSTILRRQKQGALVSMGAGPEAGLDASIPDGGEPSLCDFTTV